MKRLLIIFLVLILLALAATVAGILLSEGGGGGLGGATVLVWRVQGQIPERARPDLFSLSSSLRPQSVASLYRGFRQGLDDPNVRGLAVYIRDTGFGFAKAEELRRQLQAFSDAGKFVECYFESVGEGTNGTLAYYLASPCDTIQMAPVGAVNLLGLYADSLFFRGTLDKLHVEPQYFTVGEYKSAGEQFTRTDHSGPAEEALSGLLDSWYQILLDGIAAGRGMETDQVRRLIDGAPYTADEALASGLVDRLAYPDEFRAHVEELAGGSPNLVRLETYGQHPSFSGQKIAVVFAPGTIVRGSGGADPWTEESFLGADDLSNTLRTLRDDSSIRAVVLRIDSPGGSAIASDLILREVELLAAEKPVVASMSDLAASGGYYIAAKANRIVAERGTITGSIGVVAGRFATSQLERETLGLSRDPLSRGAHAGLWRDPRPMDADRAARVQKLMDPIYAAFVGHVAEGRGMSVEEVEPIARGRVWSGDAAAAIGLVDELGGIDRAVEIAKELAGVAPEEDVRLLFFPEPRSWLALFADTDQPLLPASLRALAKRLAARPSGALELSPRLADLPSSL